MKSVKIAALIVIALAFAAILGCARPDSAVVGRWKNISLQETVEFKKDKTGFFEVKDNPALPFTWSDMEGNKIKIDVIYMGRSRILWGKIDKGSLILEGRGERAVYKKTN